VLAMGKSPGHATTGKYHGEKRWMVSGSSFTTTRQDDVNPKPFHVQQYFSYDPEKKLFVAVEFDNMGQATIPRRAPAGKRYVHARVHRVGSGKTVSLRDVFTHTPLRTAIPE